LFQVIRTEALKTGCRILLIRAVSGSTALTSHCTGGEAGHERGAGENGVWPGDREPARSSLIKKCCV
jgi:hypothetical protein